MFAAPPAAAAGEAPGSGKHQEKQQDWCIGCACPAQELLSA
jgi:invasion protein IalB